MPEHGGHGGHGLTGETEQRRLNGEDNSSSIGLVNVGLLRSFSVAPFLLCVFSIISVPISRAPGQSPGLVRHAPTQAPRPTSPSARRWDRRDSRSPGSPSDA